MITSTSNPRIQSARRLRRRSGRDDAGEYLVEGTRAVVAALEVGAPVRDVFLDPDAPGADAVTAAAQRVELGVTHVSDRVVKALTESTTPQGAVAVLGAPLDRLDSMDESVDLVLVLAGVSDPGNAGTLIRSAVAAGAGAVIFTTGCVDVLNPKTVRATAGNLWATRIIREISLGDAAADLKGRGFALVGTDASAERSHQEVDLGGPSAIVVGNEAWGLPEDARAIVDATVSIRMPGPVESLNAAIAGSLLLFEAVRQRSTT
ncbi:MAG TPA: RNA methyltransferase [Actinomycetota bacterium]